MDVKRNCVMPREFLIRVYNLLSALDESNCDIDVENRREIAKLIDEKANKVLNRAEYLRNRNF